MNPGGISVTRVLPIDGALLGDVLLRLRRDSAASMLRWTLGGRGSAEVDASFASAGTSWTTTARLWNETGLAVAAATLELTPGTDEVRLTLEPTLPPAAAWGKDGQDLADLARATLDELAEELLWHATRAELTPRG
jgi:hypothetical protein